MKRVKTFITAVLLCAAFCCVPLGGRASGVSGSGWIFEDGVLTITGDMGYFHVASSSSAWMTTSPFESSGILRQVNRVVVNEGVKEIGGLAFYGMSNMTEISLPSTLELIDSEAFWYCDSLREITIPEKVRTIGVGVFSRCASLQKVTFEGDAPDIHNWSYWYDGSNTCPPLKSSYVSPPEMDIYYNSDRQWTAADMRALGGGSTYINWHDVNILASGTCGDSASWIYDAHHRLTIYGTGAIEATYSGNRNPWKDYNDEIKSVVVQDGITDIPQYTFEYMTNVTSVRLPDTLVSLACNAFNDCHSLPNLSIPTSLVSFVANHNFNSCYALEDIYYRGTEEEWQQIENYQECIKFSSDSLTYHFMELHEAVPSTCAEAGHESYYSFDGPEGMTVYSSDRSELPGVPYLPLSKHALKERQATAPTCTEEGAEAYWECEVCGKTFSDGEGKTEIEKDSWIIPMTAHEWQEPTYEWTEDNSSVTASRECINGNHPETETVKAERELVTAPTETEEGEYAIVSDPFENEAFEKQSLTGLMIPALKDMNILRLPASLKKIETGAFEGIAADAVIVPDDCGSIESGAFVNCPNLIYIRVPAGIDMPKDALIDCPEVVTDRR